MTHRVTWLAGQHGCALAGASWWALCLGRLRPLAPAALAGRPGGGGRRGRGRRGRGVPRGLVRLRRSSAVRRPRQRRGRAPIFAGGERPGPGPQRAAARVHQGALSIPRGRVVAVGLVDKVGMGKARGWQGGKLEILATPQTATSAEEAFFLLAHKTAETWGSAQF